MGPKGPKIRNEDFFGKPPCTILSLIVKNLKMKKILGAVFEETCFLTTTTTATTGAIILWDLATMSHVQKSCTARVKGLFPRLIPMDAREGRLGSC